MGHPVCECKSYYSRVRHTTTRWSHECVCVRVYSCRYASARTRVSVSTSTSWSLNLHKIVIRTDYALHCRTSSRLRPDPKIVYSIIIIIRYTRRAGRDNVKSSFKYDIYRTGAVAVCVTKYYCRVQRTVQVFIIVIITVVRDGIK